MKETGIINRNLSRILSELGQGDQMILSDAVFAIPTDVEVVDLSLEENVPRVEDALASVLKHFSVEEAVVAEKLRAHSPGVANGSKELLGGDVGWKAVPRGKLKERE